MVCSSVFFVERDALESRPGGCVSIACSFLSLSNIPGRGWTMVYPLTVEEHLGCSQFAVITKKAAMDIPTQVSVQTYFA